jgi:hypothetical protein
MRTMLSIFAVLALASLVLTDARSPSTSANEAVPYSRQATQIAQRKKVRKPPNEPDSLKQYEQDRLKGWYRVDHA